MATTNMAAPCWQARVAPGRIANIESPPAGILEAILRQWTEVWPPPYALKAGLVPGEDEREGLRVMAQVESQMQEADNEDEDE